MTVTVRRLGPDDLAAYREIRLEALKNHPGAYGDSWDSAKDRPDSAFREMLERSAMFGAFNGESRLVGLIAFVQEQGAKVRHKADIYQVYVRPEARGAGCGLALVNAVVEHARPLVTQIHLYVSVENKEAIRLYERAGFHIYGTEPRAMYVDGRYIDEHMMVRFLDEGARKEDANE